MGKSLTQGNVTILVTRYSNRPFPDALGPPQVAPELLKEGVTVSATTSSQPRTAFKVTIKYHGDGDSLLTATTYLERSDSLDVKGAATFEIGSAGVASIQ